MPRRNNKAKADAIAKTVQSGPTVRVEYPREGEVVTYPHYTFQIAAILGANEVEVSIDRGEWKPCRESVGLWWYDWNDCSKGEHVLVARIRAGNDPSAPSAPRRFTVA